MNHVVITGANRGIGLEFARHYSSAGWQVTGVCRETSAELEQYANRVITQIDVTDESLSVDVIRQVCLDGPGHFLGSDQTLALMQREYVYPVVGDRTSPKEWKEIGSTNVVQKARDRLQKILASHYPSHIGDEVDRAIRAEADIKLPREFMRPGNGRW